MFIACYLLLLLLNPINAQDIKFERISVEQGLSNNQIRCVLQDKYGFIWIGTHDGLNRYDGYKFTIYRNNPADSMSLTSNWITGLYEDRSGDLWISTMSGGLNKFDRQKEQFRSFESKPFGKKNGLDATTIKQIAEYHYSSEKVLWIGTWTGLHKFDLETEMFTHYPHTDKSAPYSHIQTVAVDKNGMVWIGSLKDGLHRFNPETKQFTHFRHDPDNPNSISDDQIFALYFDCNNILWIGTATGLNRFESDKEEFTSYKYDPNDLQSISSNSVRSIYEDHAGLLWIGTSDGGLNIFDRIRQDFIRFLHYNP